MKSKRTKVRKIRKTRKQKGGVNDDEVIEALKVITDTGDLTFISVGRKLKDMMKETDYRFTREKWIEIMKGLYERYRIKIMFGQTDDVSRTMLAFYQDKESPTIITPVRTVITKTPTVYDDLSNSPLVNHGNETYTHLTPQQRLERYLESSYEQLKRIVAEGTYVDFVLMKNGLNVRRTNGELFRPNDSQWEYLLVRLHNEKGTYAQFGPLDSPELQSAVALYYINANDPANPNRANLRATEVSRLRRLAVMLDRGPPAFAAARPAFAAARPAFAAARPAFAAARPTWDCTSCTLKNNGDSSNCAACETPRDSMELWRCRNCLLDNPHNFDRCRHCGAPAPTH